MDILYEDNHLLIVNKVAGDLVQGDSTGDETLVDRGKEYLKRKYQKPGNVFLGLVHRLDRPVSGIVVMARTSKALERMNLKFKQREVVKRYWAVVESLPPADSQKLTHWLAKDTRRNVVHAHRNRKPGAQKAELEYQLVGRSGKWFLLEVLLLTGRPHQIRAQLRAINCPIVGDLKYGSTRKASDGSILLHARSLEFTHPVKQEDLEIVAEPPRGQVWKDFLALRST